MDNPQFSIVIPTRNRASLLQDALESALRQDFDSFEILVSNNASQDDTEDVVKRLSDKRVRYIKTERTLSMPDHWEFAIEQARGEYVTFLCDDDARTPDSLSKVSQAISETSSKLLVIGFSTYYSNNWPVEKLQNTLHVPQGSRSFVEQASSATLKELTRCRMGENTPRMLNTFCERALISRLRKQFDRIFYMCPDYSFPLFVLPELDSWILVDYPLHLQGVFREGIGASQVFDRKGPAEEFLKEFQNPKIVSRTPLKIEVVTNFIAETFLQVKEKLGPRLSHFEIDWVEYFATCGQNLNVLEQNGVDVSQDRAEFLEVLWKQPRQIRTRVSKKLGFEDPLLKSRFEGLLTAIEATFIGATKSEVMQGPEPMILNGKKAGFNSILEAAEMLPGLISGEKVLARV